MRQLATSQVSDTENIREWFNFIKNLDRFEPGKTKKEQASEAILDVYYYRRHIRPHEIFLLKQNKFVPLENLDEKIAEYRDRLNSKGFKDSFTHLFDFRIMTLLKEYQPEFKFLKDNYPDTLRNSMAELGAGMLKLILFQPKEEWEAGYEKIRNTYAELFEDSRKLPPTRNPEKIGMFVNSLLPEPIPAEEPKDLPEQGYFTKLMIESPELRKWASDAVSAARKMWRGIIPADDARKTPIPYESPKPASYLPDLATVKAAATPADKPKPEYSAAPATNGKRHAPPITSQTDLLKALGYTEGLGELEKTLEEPEKNSAEKKEEIPSVQEGKKLINYDPRECRRDPVNPQIIRCLESANKYQECARQNPVFKTWQCCKPGGYVN